MTTLYALLRDRCGLSVDEAAALHGVRPDTIKSWSSGRRAPPPRAIEELRDLYYVITRQAACWIRAAMQTKDDELVVDPGETCPSLPYVGANKAMFGIVAASVDCSVKIATKENPGNPPPDRAKPLI